MSQSDSDKGQDAEERSRDTKSFVRRVRSVTRRKYTSEEKIRIVLAGISHIGSLQAQWAAQTRW